MSGKGIVNQVGFLKLTRAGKIRLTVFEDKVLYKALSLLKNLYQEMPDNPYNTFYACCMRECYRINSEPTWDKMSRFPNFDNHGAVTELGEKFDMQLCHKLVDEINKKPYKRQRNNNTGRSKYGPSFDEGVEYYKYGQWYKYPDQAIHKETNPSQPDPNEKIRESKPERLTINIGDELKKAIASGNINKDGLAFLRNTFLNKPDILEIIDTYLTK